MKRLGGSQLAFLYRDHPHQDAFEGHGVAARRPFAKEATGTVPGSIAQGYLVITVFAVERDVKAVYLHSMALARVDLCLFDFADQARLNDLLSLQELECWKAQTAAH